MRSSPDRRLVADVVHHVLEDQRHVVALVRGDPEGAEHHPAVAAGEGRQQGHGGEGVLALAFLVVDRAGEVDADEGLHIGHRRPHREVVEDLDVGGAQEVGEGLVGDLGRDDVSPLYIATTEDRSDVVEVLLAKAANVNLCRSNGRSPVACAVHKDHPDSLRLLLNAKGDPSLTETIPVNNGVTKQLPLMVAFGVGP